MCSDEELQRRLEALRRRHGVGAFRRDRTAPVADALRALSRQPWFTSNYALKDLKRAWVEAAGPKAAQHCSVEGVRKGVMLVIVDSAALRQELAGFHKARILADVRKYKGCESIQDIEFRIGKADQGK